MSLQFITGGGNTNHQQAIIDIASEWLANPQQDVFFLVPNYNKFEREQELLSQLKRQQNTEEFTSIRGQVYSFNRLAWYFLQRTGQFGGTMISEVGSAMIMRKVLESLTEQLTIFRGEINKSGFIAQLIELYKEFQLGNIHAEELQFSSENTDFELKMKEVQLIFTVYEEELLQRQLQIEQPIPMLTRYLTHTGEFSSSTDLPNLKKSLFIVSGFANFSAQEQALLQVLMQQSHLCVDIYIDNVHKESDTMDLFFEAQQTYNLLKNFSRIHQIPVLFDKKATLLEKTTGYSVVENYWRTNEIPTTSKKTLKSFLEIWKAETPEEELRQIGVEIRRLVAASAKSPQPIRYRDIQLVTLNPEIYYSLIPIVFDELAIPYYLDEDRKMEQHPLVEFIHALFALDKYYYRLSDIFRFLRTELYIPQEMRVGSEDWQQARNQFRHAVDITENKALSHHFQGNDWLKVEDWQLIEYNFEERQLADTVSVEEQTNQIRRAFRRDIAAFFKKIKAAKTTYEALEIFYQFLIQQGIEEQLIHWRNQEIERGHLEQARNHEQTWSSLMDLLDEFSEIYGENTFNFDLFEEILSSGLANLTFGKIPTAIDQVKINPLDLARPMQAKITFAIGLDETTFPRKIENKTLLSSEERAQLNAVLKDDQYLRDHVGETLRNEPFVAYNVLLSASDKLYMTYAANNDTQQNIKMSPYLVRLVDGTGIEVQNRKSLTLESNPAYYVGTYRGLIRQLNSLYRQTQDAKINLPNVWRWMEKQLRGEDKQLAERVFASQSHRNVPVSLPQETALALYGTEIHSSISRMETFYQCEYRYFVDYGLRLNERDIYGLNPAITGEFFHDALDRFLTVLIEENISLSQLTAVERDDFVDHVLKEIFGEIRYNLLNRSARMNFIRHQLSKTIQRVTWALHKQGEKTQLSPVQTEVLFGQIAGKSGLPGLQLPLNSGGQLHLRGKIDRIDTAIVDGQPWLSVVDYKSSSREFDLTEAYYGLAMQLVTYLDVALTDAVELIGRNDAKIAGAYYFHVHNPVMDHQKATDDERLKQYKYDGLFVDDAEVFPIYDETLTKSKNSALFPIRKDKNETIQKITQSKDKFYTEEEINYLIQHNRKKMIDGGNRILSGEIALNPSYKMKDKKRACQHCPFRSICTFDVMLQENEYHRMKQLSKEEIIERMREEEND